MGWLVIPFLVISCAIPIGFLFLAGLGFGLELAWTSVLFDVGVASSPPGRVEMEHLPRSPSLNDRLAHSTPYEDPVILNKIMKWIQTKANSGLHAGERV